jgi:alkylation response protein AidB-like acyl-CoA dehydrogenase
MYDYLLSEENRKFRDEVREFVRNAVPPSLLKKLDKDEIQYPTEYLRALAKQNLIGIRVPIEYGGRGLNWESEVIALEEIGVLGSSLACLFSLPSICGEALTKFGTEDQKQNYLLSLFIVDRNSDINVEYLFGLLGTRGGGAGRIRFNNVKVPQQNIILEEGAGGQIFYQMMVPERLTTASGFIGLARASLRIATKYSTKRKAFGQTIKNFQGVSFKIADSITLLDAVRAMVFNTAKSIDAGAPAALQRRLVSESKKFSTKACWKVINNAMQIMGGIGYTTVYPIERLLRDARLGEIWTGTTEIMNLIIQHEYFKEILSEKWLGRDIELDAIDADQEEEKHYG